ncbi:splicing factor 3B family member protein [Theileria equi strain WA]|uniref:Splicing factor 3B family member protein n=1 Tax=Theileria equi strain WA TaxID=1537102 RepID=L0AWI1_THEEQ|nr:splicing factor 3B family member protein [Theileria equi strain WA]AFZ79376.1 splicing factor 3B family member protein [Theileria equi strain WA]|eukprot:XP_004829042.1 splicing factor 3B family member protein [Theileria equi strain WA]
MSSYDRFNIHAQLEHLQSKYQGTGHVDNTKWEWVLNIQRDTLASHAGHFTRLAYFAIVENEATARIKHRCLQVCMSPPKCAFWEPILRDTCN